MKVEYCFDGYEVDAIENCIKELNIPVGIEVFRNEDLEGQYNVVIEGSKKDIDKLINNFEGE